MTWRAIPGRHWLEAGLGPAARRALEAQLNAEGRLDSFRPLVDVARVFQQLDQDGSGTLSAAELGAALTALGVVGVVGPEHILADIARHVTGRQLTQ